MSSDDQGFSSYKLSTAIFPPSAFCRLVRLKRVLRFHMYCYQIQWFLSEVICWNESIWSALPLYACVFVHVIYSTIFIIRQIKIHIFPCSWFSIAKGASVTTLQDKARDSQAKFHCSHLVIIHIIIQFSSHWPLCMNINKRLTNEWISQFPISAAQSFSVNTVGKNTWKNKNANQSFQRLINRSFSETWCNTLKRLVAKQRVSLFRLSLVFLHS